MANRVKDLKDYSREIAAVLDAARSVLKYRTFQEAARSIFDAFKKLIGATSGYVALLSEDGAENEVLFLDAGGLPCSVDPYLPMPIRGLRGDAYHTGQPVCENDFMNSKWVKFMPEGHVVLNNVLFAPLILEGKAIGLIGVANKEGGFVERDLELAEIFAEIAAIALRNSYLLESLESSEKMYKKAYENSEFYKSLLSHDFNNILQAILSATQMCAHYFNDPNILPQLKKGADIITRNVSKGAELINTIAKLSEAEEASSNLQPIAVLDFLKNAINFTKESFQEKEINIQIESNTSKIFVLANAFLQEVFDNLVHNSIKFNPKSPCESLIKLSEIKKDDTQYVKLEFIDHGIGIPDADKQSIFERGYKINREAKGMGLGLFLVKGIISQFNGAIRVEDRVAGDYSKGSNFIILLPKVTPKKTKHAK